MTKILSRDKIQRMAGGGAGGAGVSVSSTSGGGGASGNAVSLDYYNQSFTLLYKTVVTVTDSESEVISTTTTYTTSAANTLLETGTTTEYDDTTGYTTTTTVTLIGPQSMGGLGLGQAVAWYDSNTLYVENRTPSTALNVRMSGMLNGVRSIELNNHPDSYASGIGGFIDFHYGGTSDDYSARLVEWVRGALSVDAALSGTGRLAGLTIGAAANNGAFVAGGYDGSFLQIGDIRIVYDSANNALKVEKYDGTVANFYATGGVSALGTT